MHPKWLLLTILYLLKVMYLYLLILEIWQRLLRVIAVFLDVEEQYLQTSKAVIFFMFIDPLKLSDKLFEIIHYKAVLSFLPF